MILGNSSQGAQRVLSVLPAGVRRRLPPHLYLPFSRPYWLVKGGRQGQSSWSHFLGLPVVPLWKGHVLQGDSEGLYYPLHVVN